MMRLMELMLGRLSAAQMPSVTSLINHDNVRHFTRGSVYDTKCFLQCDQTLALK